MGPSGGCEAAVHAARRFLRNIPADHAIVKLDFINAFNSLHGGVMLTAVAESAREIYKFCHSSYNSSLQLNHLDHWVAKLHPFYLN